MHGLHFELFGLRLLSPPTGSGVRFSLLQPEPDWICILCLLKKRYWLFAWLTVYLCGVKQELNCMCRDDTGSETDSDLNFGKQECIRFEKNQSPHTSRS